MSAHFTAAPAECAIHSGNLKPQECATCFETIFGMFMEASPTAANQELNPEQYTVTASQKDGKRKLAPEFDLVEQSPAKKPSNGPPPSAQLLPLAANMPYPEAAKASLRSIVIPGKAVDYDAYSDRHALSSNDDDEYAEKFALSDTEKRNRKGVSKKGGKKRKTGEK